MNIPRRQAISEEPLSATEFAMLLILHRTSVEQLTDDISTKEYGGELESRVQVSYVISRKRIKGPVVERIRRKLAKRFGFRYEVMWGEPEPEEQE